MTFAKFKVSMALVGSMLLSLAACEQAAEERLTAPSFLQEGEPLDQKTALAHGDFTSCAVCHGTQLQGNVGTNAPRLNHLPGWYIKAQLLAFQKGWRGQATGDISGNAMMASALLLDPTGIEAATQYVERGADNRDFKLAGFDPSGKGAQLYLENCAACHGNNGEGQESLLAPPLAGISHWYFKAQMQKFREGQRGYGEEDQYGQSMRMIAQALSDDDVAALLLFIAGDSASK